MTTNNAVDIVKDEKGNSVVKINNIIFRGKQNIDWKAVEMYLQDYVGKVIEVVSEEIRIGKEFPDEYADQNIPEN